MAQQPAQQPAQRSQSPLDQLQANLNFALMQVGQMTSNPVNRRDAAKRAGMFQGVPGANSRFQDALDRLEVDLVRARAVLRRDLAKCRAAREQREKAAQEKPTNNKDTNNVKAEKAPDTVIKGEAQPPTATASDPNASISSAPATKPAQDEESWTMPAVTTFVNQMPPGTSSPISAAPQTSTSAPTAPPLSATLPTDTFTAASPSATGADMEDIDFDSMFEDLDNPEPGNQSFGQTDTNVDVADVSSLLTGIDTYANIQDADAAGGGSQVQKVEGGEEGGLDFGMLDLPSGEEGGKQEGDLHFGDNSFEELFELDNWTGGEGGGEGDGGFDEFLKDLEG